MLFQFLSKNSILNAIYKCQIESWSKMKVKLFKVDILMIMQPKEYGFDSKKSKVNTIGGAQ